MAGRFCCPFALVSRFARPFDLAVWQAIFHTSRPYGRPYGRQYDIRDDTWFMGKPLKEDFKRLVRLDPNPNVKVADRVSWIDLKPILKWDWSRVVTGRTKGELDDLETLLASMSMDPGKEDSCFLKLSGCGKFSTQKLTKNIMAKNYPSNANCLATMKNNLEPKKVGVFVWRAKRERLPVLVELDKWGIDLHSVRCPLCDDDVESVKHSLLECKYVSVIWEKILVWWGFDSVNLSFGNLLRGFCPLQCSELGNKIWQAVEWTSCYLIWKNRNQKVFKKTNCSPPIVLSEIQVKSYKSASLRFVYRTNTIVLLRFLEL
ncbi:uncharacterized protein [Rutidosis leptorrhynchoides]|uniref:uncharacterized protein n=1 Tax=Rutidosis leptorrhynchoides TaxID=125765 RepID=UPI003A996E4D